MIRQKLVVSLANKVEEIASYGCTEISLALSIVVDRFHGKITYQEQEALVKELYSRGYLFEYELAA